MRFSFLTALLCVLALAQPQSAFAASPLSAAPKPLQAPNDDFTIKVIADRTTRTLSIAEIEKLPLYEITMKAPGGGEGTFSGVMLVDLLKHLGLSDANQLFFRAADDYKLVLDIKQETGFAHILFATRLNGQTVPLAEHGPFRLMWTDQADAAEKGTITTVKWIWSLVEIRKVN